MKMTAEVGPHQGKASSSVVRRLRVSQGPSRFQPRHHPYGSCFHLRNSTAGQSMQSLATLIFHAKPDAPHDMPQLMAAYSVLDRRTMHSSS